MSNSMKLRGAYLDFFTSSGHSLRPSAPLIPPGDPTLMFNSAGMVPFKPYFLGLKTDLKRATSSQKCLRTTDIDRVGHTVRHLTFFEMLGNFSFGDYFKEEAIAWAWEFLTAKAGLDPKRLHPTVFKDDSEAEALWRKHPILNPVVRLGEDSNFWAVGPTGPCGPCSEIYFDRGAAHSCGKPSCAVGCDCDRYLEVWNLVFMQFDRQPGGELKPLPRKNIDTGMGLERLAFALEETPSPFETAFFSPVMEKASQLLGSAPSASAESQHAFRVIADHARAAVMLAGEGILPSNVERGYVLRRLIRRAVRFGGLVGPRGAFFHKLAPAVAEIFPEIKDSLIPITETLKAEEEKFLETLEKGEAELQIVLSKVNKQLPGDQAFKLYETFGFPLELTKEICAKTGITVDEEGFSKASALAVDVARASWKGSGEKASLSSLVTQATTEFTGYESLEEKTSIVACSWQERKGVVVLEKTPFYPEGGGQVGDEGLLYKDDGKTPLAKVLDTQKQGAAILHIVELLAAAAPRVGETVVAKVDVVRRGYISPHHTGTHLLNEALRRILGAHVRQAGSYVGADKLRFDFTHPKSLGSELIQKVEYAVAEEISKGHRVETKVDSAEKVKEYGAVTLMGEDYGARPRFVLIGPRGWQDYKDRFSLELCGGTHLRNTAEMSGFRIIKESSVASGVRRIEALAGRAVEDYEKLKGQEREATLAQLQERERTLLTEVAALGGKAEELPASERTESRLRVREKELLSLLSGLKSKRMAESASTGSLSADVDGIHLVAQRVEGADPKSLRGLADKIKGEVGSGLVLLACPQGGKLSFVLAATPDLAAKKIDAARLAKDFAAARGGSAGGRADFAQGGLPECELSSLLEALADGLRKGLTS